MEPRFQKKKKKILVQNLVRTAQRGPINGAPQITHGARCTAQSQHSHSTVKAQSQHSHSTYHTRGTRVP